MALLASNVLLFLNCGKSNEVLCRLELPPVDVDGVAEGLKGVKADADRQDDLPSCDLHFDAH